MKDIAIKKICLSLIEKGYDFSDKTLLDAFSRDGSWQTKHVASLVKITHAWEIDKAFESELKKNLPENSIVKICDSHKMIASESEKFDIIIFDNPLSCYGVNKEYSEHFDIMKDFTLVSKEKVLIIFNVKTKPYNYNENIDWQKRRNVFYEVEDASNLDLKFLDIFYTSFFKKMNYDKKFSLLEKRPQEEDLYQFAFLLEKV